MATSTQTKPQNDAYTGILFISLLALIGACVLLYLDYEQYGQRTPPKAPQLEPPGKSLEKAPVSTTIPTPKGNVPVPDPNANKNEPNMMKAPIKPMGEEVTSVKPVIQPPPLAPAPIPMLTLPSTPPTPVLTAETNPVLPAKFETLEAVKPITPVIEEIKPVKAETPLVPEVKPEVKPEPVKPTTPPSLYDGPPVLRPFVPGK
jgi:hypothetical protein